MSVLMGAWTPHLDHRLLPVFPPPSLPSPLPHPNFHPNFHPYPPPLPTFPQASLSGSLWGKALLGQRAQRIEMLLLHEFYDKKFLLPDKLSNKVNNGGLKGCFNQDGCVAGETPAVAGAGIQAVGPHAASACLVSMCIWIVVGWPWHLSTLHPTPHTHPPMPTRPHSVNRCRRRSGWPGSWLWRRAARRARRRAAQRTSLLAKRPRGRRCGGGWA